MRTAVVSSFLFLTLVLGASTAHALEFKSIGVKAGGAVMSTEFTFAGTNQLDNDTRLMPIVGVSTMWQLQRRSAFRFVVEALYVRKGYEGTRTLEGIDVEAIDVSVNADYLAVPILGRVLFSEDDLSIYAVFGPSLEFLLGNDDDVLLDEFTSWSLAGNVGIGLEYEIGEAQAQFELRFNTDLISNFDGDEDIFNIDEARYQMLQITGGIRF